MPNEFEKILGDAGDPNETKTNEEVESLKKEIDSLKQEVQTYKERVDILEEEPIEETPAEPEKTWTPQTWKEVEGKMEEKTEEAFEAKEEELRERQEQEKVALQAIDKDFDEQLATMEKSGDLTPMKDDKDPNDVGRGERKEIFGLAAKLGTTNLIGVGEIVKAQHENGMAFDVSAQKFIRTNTSGFGKTVPVGSSSARTGGTQGKIDYKTLHNASMDELIRRSQE